MEVSCNSLIFMLSWRWVFPYHKLENILKVHRVFAPLLERPDRFFVKNAPFFFKERCFYDQRTPFPTNLGHLKTPPCDASKGPSAHAFHPPDVAKPRSSNSIQAWREWLPQSRLFLAESFRVRGWYPKDPITEPENGNGASIPCVWEVIIHPNHHLTRWLHPYGILLVVQKSGEKTTSDA